jgi:hypothetical protein
LQWTAAAAVWQLQRFTWVLVDSHGPPPSRCMIVIPVHETNKQRLSAEHFKTFLVAWLVDKSSSNQPHPGPSMPIHSFVYCHSVRLLCTAIVVVGHLVQKLVIGAETGAELG